MRVQSLQCLFRLVVAGVDFVFDSFQDDDLVPDAARRLLERRDARVYIVVARRRAPQPREELGAAPDAALLEQRGYLVAAAVVE